MLRLDKRPINVPHAPVARSVENKIAAVNWDGSNFERTISHIPYAHIEVEREILDLFSTARNLCRSLERAGTLGSKRHSPRIDNAYVDAAVHAISRQHVRQEFSCVSHDVLLS